MGKQGSNGIRAIGKRELLQGEIAPMSQVSVSSSIEPKSLAELLALSLEQLAAVDIARANLLCAEGLPGAEGLNVEVSIRILNSWAKQTELILERSYTRFQENPAEYMNSEPYWRMYMLTSTLWGKFNVRYNKERMEDENWSDSRDGLIHGLIGDKHTGTCSSMPVLVVALGRRLHFPVYLVHTLAHLFVRWESPDKKERFNIEFNGDGMSSHTDQYYREWPVKWPPEIIALENKRGEKSVYLRNLTPAEELAHALSMRGACLETAGRYEEAIEAYDAAARFGPNNPAYPNFSKAVLTKMRSANDLLNHVIEKTPNFNPEFPAEIAVKTMTNPNGVTISLDYKQLPHPIPAFDPLSKPPTGISPALSCIRNIVNQVDAKNHPLADFKYTTPPADL
jgi:hypothetical protein